MSNYCIHKGILCVQANEYGHCSITACNRPLPITYNNTIRITDTAEWNHTHTSDELPAINNFEAEWRMVLDDFDDGAGIRELPHCSNCFRGVYKHDAGRFCTFCGSPMKNPLVV